MTLKYLIYIDAVNHIHYLIIIETITVTELLQSVGVLFYCFVKYIAH